MASRTEYGADCNMDELIKSLAGTDIDAIEDMVVDMIWLAFTERFETDYRDEWSAIQTAWHLKTGHDPYIRIRVE